MISVKRIFSRRKFFFVKDGDIARNRPETDVKTVPNTRKIHQIVNTTVNVDSTEAPSLKVRNLSCFCRYCEKGTYDHCLNAAYVDSFVTKTLTFNQSSTANAVNNKALKDPVEKKPRSNEKISVDLESQKKRQKPQTKKSGSDVMNKQPSHTFQAENADAQGRNEYFQLQLGKLQKLTDYSDLEAIAPGLLVDCINRFSQTTCNPDVNVVDAKLTGDSVAQALIPEEWTSKIAVRVLGDGNCLARSGSVLAFEHENNHIEIRYRIILELVTHSNLYLNIAYVNKGATLPPSESKSLLDTYVMFSEQYTPGHAISAAERSRIYKAEVLSVLKQNTFMGIWQVMALCSVLGCKLYFVYPNLGHGLCRQTLNRLVLPREERCSHTVSIMWTSNRDDMVPANWVPNHFVPLLPLTQTSPDLTTMDVDDSMSDSFQELIDSDLVTQLIDSIRNEELNSGSMSDENQMPDSPEISHISSDRVGASPVGESVETAPDEKTSLNADETLSEFNPIKGHDVTPVAPVVCVEDHDENPMPSYGDRQPPCTVEESLKTAPDEKTNPNAKEALPVNQLRSGYSSGEYLLIKHGKSWLPAVVDEWPWVSFFKKFKKKTWVINDVKHTIFQSDVERRLEPPDVSMLGSRLLYTFQELLADQM